MRLVRKETALLKRPVQGYYNEHRDWIVPDAPQSTPFKCSIQPDLDSFTQVVESSGVRSEDFLVIYTKTKLNTADETKTVAQSQGQPADKIEIDDHDYIVFSAKKWRGAMRLSHYECLLIKEDAFVNNNKHQ